MNTQKFDRNSNAEEQKKTELSLLNVGNDCHIESILQGGKSSRALGVIIIVLFIGILLSFLLNFGVSAYLGSEELAENYYDGSEHPNIVFPGFTDTFYLSSKVQKNIINVDYYLFGRLPTDSVLLGEDEFLFPTNDEKYDYNYVADYLGELYPTSNELNLYYTGIQEITEEYAKRKVKCYFVIIPNSQTVYSERMPEFMGNISERTRLGTVTDYLARRGVDNYLDLTNALIAAKENGELYNNTEDSLNSRGAYYAYRAVLDMLPDLATQKVTPVELSEGDLVRHTTAGKELARTASLENVIKNRTVSLSTDFKQKYQILLRYEHYDMAFARMQYKNDLPSLPRIGFQFSNEWDRIIFIDYFSNTFGTTIYRTSVDFNELVISKTDPSYVICFLHEKELSKLIDGSMLP